MSGHHGARAASDTTEEIRVYIQQLMTSRPEPTPNQIQTVRDLLPPAAEWSDGEQAQAA